MHMYIYTFVIFLLVAEFYLVGEVKLQDWSSLVSLSEIFNLLFSYFIFIEWEFCFWFENFYLTIAIPCGQGSEQNGEENAEEQNGEEGSQEEPVVVDADSTDGAVLVNGNEAEEQWGTNNEGIPSA